jgi:hypothetical protein
VEAVLKMPDNTIPQLKILSLEDWIKQNIQREDFAVTNMITDLPANASAGLQCSDTLLDNCPFSRKVIV